MNKPLGFRFLKQFQRPVKDGGAAERLRKGLRESLSYRALEQRIAFDAAGVITVQEVSQDAQAPVSADVGHVPDAAADAAELYEATQGLSPVQPAGAGIVFIDNSVADISSLIAGLDASAEIVILQPDRDGVVQIAEALAGRTGISGIHIISHGAEGVLQLGNTTLDATSMQGQHLDELTAIGQALSADGDILIYGCNFTGGEAGLEAAMILGGITGADIAASSDDTGHVSLGGDWDLETEIGSVEEMAVDASSWFDLLNLSVTATTNTATIQTALVPSNAGISVTSLTLPTGTTGSYVGTFNQVDSNIGLENGVVLATGNIASVPNAPSNQWDGVGSGSNTSYAPITTITSGAQYDVARIQLNFTPDAGTNKIAVYYVFASEEYPEYVGSAFNDAFGFFISGNNPSGGTYSNTNFAMIPGTSTPVSINNVNATSNSAYYVSNAGLPSPANILDGQTVPLSALVDVTSGSSYTVNLAIADIGDANWNSAVFLSYFGSSLRLDLDANNSTASGLDYLATYTEQSAAIAVVDADMVLQNFDPTTDITQATITLTNKQAGDLLTVGTLPAGITATVTNTATTTTIALSGSASESAYETAIKAIRFSNSSDTPSNVQRQITVRAYDGETFSGTAVSRININATPDPVADSFSMSEDASLSGNVLTNDTDLGTSPIASVSVVTGPSSGTLTSFNTTTGAFTYQPVANFSGTDTFTYQVTDANGDTATAIATINVAPVNDAPANTMPGAVNGSIGWTTSEDVSVGLTGLSIADIDAGSGPVTVTLAVGSGTLLATSGGSVTVGGSGTGTLTLTGTIANINAYLAAASRPTYAPAANAYGSVTLTMTTNDGGNTGSGGTLTDVDNRVIAIVPQNDNPDAVDDAVTIAEDSAATVIDVLGNDSFAPDAGETLSVSAVTQPANGTVTLVGGVVSYQPDANFFGTDTFTYTISDGNGGSDTATVTVTVTPQNDNPDALDDAVSVNEDSGATVIDVLGNDSFAPDAGETLSVSAVTQPANGTVTLVGGVVSYQPDANFFGTDTFTYTISDGNGGSDTATVTVTVTPQNDNPDALDDAVSVNEDSGATVIDVLGNDSFAPDAGETLTVSAVTQPANGTVTLVGGVVSYQPDANFFGTDTFTYTISDGNGGSDTATVTVTVTPQNDNPDAVDDAVSVNEDSGATVIDVLGNDSFAPDAGETLSVSAVTQPANGTVTLVGGVVSYTPDANFFGTDTFTYTISDGNGGSDTATVTVTVTPQNDNPDALDDAVTIAEDSAATVIDVLGNDSFAPDAGETLSVSAVTQPANGTVTLVGGVVSYQPDANFFGTDTFTYTISDGNGGSDTATVTVTVTPQNDNPDALDDAVSVAEDSAATVIDVLGNDSFAPDAGETLSVSAVTQPANGTVTLVGGVVSYQPDANFFGIDTFTYTISDGNGGSDTATVTVTVTPQNDNPDAVDDAVTIAEDSAATVIDVLGNDSFAPDAGETLTVSAVTQPANGTVTLVGGVVSYQPDANFFGTDTFTYTISDGNGGSDTATVTVTVTPQNDNPDAVDDAVSVNEDSGATVIDVLGNDSFAPDAGETLSVSAVTQPANGTVTLVGGVVSYTPDANFFGTDTFTYTISDGNGGSDTATVTVTVTPQNDNPDAVDDAVTIAEDSAATVIDVLGNDSFAPDAGETLSVSAVTQPANGTVTLVGGVVSYQPDANFFGTDTFTYTISDGNGGSDTATVTVTVTPQNDNPDAVDDAVSVNEDSGATVIDVLGNDSFAPDAGETLSVSAVTQPANGTVTLVGGVVSYQPDANFFGTDTFTYTISDGNGGSDTATVTVTVTPQNDNPDALDDAVTIAEDSAATVIDVLGNDSFAPDAGETLSVSAVTQPANGTVTLVGGVVSYQPDANFFGTDTFTYTISDGNGGSDTATVTVTVTPQNDNPDAVDDAVSVNEDSGATVIDVLGNDSFAPDAGETLSVSAVTQPANGTVTLVGGVVSYQPDANFFGTDTFTYTISDGNGGSDTATVTVTVTPQNDNPDALDDAVSVNEDSGATVIDVLGNDSFAPDAGETLSVSAVTQPANGTVTLVGGVVSYQPDANFFGTDTFTYTISDGNGGSDTATVTVTVTPQNDNPDALDDAVSVNEDSGATVIDVLGNDSFAPDAGETLSVSAVTQPANGTVTLVGGVVSYQPDANFFGTDTFTYTISDGNGGSDTATVTVTVTPQNDNPDALDDAVSVNEDSGATVIDVLGNDSFAPDAGETLSVSAVTQPANGTVTLVGGVVSYTPDANFFGTDTFTYTISDGNGGSDTATVTVTVTPQNDNPDALDDAVSVNEDSGATVIDVLGNDSFAPDAGETLSVSAVTQPANGTVTLVGGVVSYQPDANFFGTDTFTYTISDGNGGSDTATVTVTVTPQNDNPDALDDAVSVAEDSAATVIDVLGNDSFAPDAGETLSVSAVTQPANGTVTLVGGVVSYQPDANFFGTDTFTYTISDGNGGSDTATVTVTVTPQNDNPDAVDDAVTIAEDSAATVIDVLGNDSFAPDAGETLTVSAVTQPANGTVTLVGGVVSYQPDANFFGTDTFTYTISDGNGGSDTATVTVTVTPQNDNPDAVDDAVSVNEDSGATVIDVLGNDSFAPDAGETLSVSAVTQPANGTVTLVGGVVSYQPDANFFGTDTFTYTISDGNGGSDTATVTVTVTPQNDNPDAVDDAVTIAEDSAATVIDVLGNDSFAPDAGETLSVSAVTQPANGTVTLVGGVVSYTPDANFFGTDTFTYTISDGNGGSDTATVTVTVTPQNDNPDAVDDAVSVNEDSGATVIDVLGNDSFAPDAGETLTVSAVTQPANGTVTLVGGVVSYQPDANFFGTDTFTYTISDGNGGSDTATVTVTVTPQNDNPDAVDDAVTIAEDSAATVIDVLGNDSFAPDAGETLSVSAVTQPANGTVTLVGGVVSYTPDANFFGTDTFTYTISDGNGGSDTATVTVTVTPQNDNPDAVDDAVSVNEDSGATVIDVLGNDSFAPDAGETLSVSAVTQPANGTVTLVGGVVSYTPDANFFGTDTFTYTISDGNGGSDTATVTVTVTPQNDNPDALDDAVTIAEDSAATVIDVLGNDSFAPDAGETLSVSAVTQPANGTVTLVGGVVSYQPDANFFGTDTFTYTISDGNGGSDTATVTVTVTPQNDNPDALDDAVSVAEDSAATVIDVLGNDSFAPDAGETLSVSAVTQPANGTVTLVGGVVSYQPDANFFGTDTFTYTISDGNGGSDTATVTVTVTPQNDNPDALDDAVSVAEDFAATVIDVLGNDSFAPDAGETLSVSAVTQPANGTVTLVGGVVSYQPDANFFGTDTFTYTISDGNGGSDTATVTVTVTPQNDNPDAVDDAVSVNEDSGATVIDVLGNDSFAPDAGETLSVSAVTQPANGTVTLVGGVVSYQPDANFFGTDTFTYTISDGNGGSDTATVTVTVTPQNDNPDALDDAVSVNEDSGATVIDVLGNDSFAPDAGETLSVSAVTQPANGTVTLVGGVVSYQPDANFFGTDTFTYTISDGNGGSDTATVTVTVTPQNDNPDALDDAVSVNEDSGATVIDVLGNDSFAPDAGETLSVSAVTQPANGTITLVGGVVSYQPDANFFGTDTFTYTISDGNGGSDTATVTVTVTPQNDNPDALDDAVSVAEDSAATVIDVLGNDSFAPDAGETLSVSAVTQPANGTVTLVGGVVSYQPDANFFGTDTFTYTISDGNGGSDTATVTVTVTPQNDNPDAVDDAVSVNEDSGATVIDVLGNDSFAPDAGETLSVSAVTQPANGTVTLVGGVVSYTPDANFFGTDTFTYTISDGNGGSDTATVTVTVTPQNDNPDALDDAVSVNEDSGATVIDVLGNDSFAPDAGETLSVSAVTQPANGTVTLVGGVVSYQPDANFFGTDTFTYTISDGNGGSDTATVTVTVTPQNDNPDAVDDAVSVNEDSGATVIDVLGNDSFAPDAGETLSVSAVTQPANGTVTLVGGVVSYQPDANFFGTDTFTYTISDGNGGSDTATVTVTVTPQNDAPVATDDHTTIDAGHPATVDVLGNDGDIDGDALIVISATSDHGTVVINADGSLTFMPDAGFEGTALVTYVISDGHGGTDTATLHVQVGAPLVSPLPVVDEPMTPLVLPEVTPSLTVGGVVVDAVNEIDDLGGITGQIGTTGIVVAATNGVKSLDGTAALDARQGAISSVIEDERLRRLFDTLQQTIGVRPNEAWDAKGLTGFSLRFTLEGRGGDEAEQLVFESLVRERTLVLRVTTQDHRRTEAGVEYRVMQADGRPLPSWLDRVGGDLIVGKHPPSVETIDLKVTAILVDGTTVTRYVTIQTSTGEIQPMKERRADAAPTMFSDELRQQAQARNHDVERLYRALGGQ